MIQGSQVFLLKGGNIRYTENSQSHFVVRSGRVLVYILPLHGGRADRRFLLCEIPEGGKIPSLCCEAPLNYSSNEMCRWCFGLVAVDEAQLERIPVPLSDEERRKFVQDAGIRSAGFMDFEEACIEEYQLRITKELRNIYTAEQERVAAQSRGLELIYNLFRSSRQKRQIHEKTGNLLYDAIAAICDRERVTLMPLDSVLTACGRSFSAEDVARLSHFVCRDVVLDEDWYLCDCGPVLAYYEENGHPVACLPRSAHRYDCYDPATGETCALTAELASQLSPQAKMMYRSFPAKPMKMWELWKFGLRDVRRGDVVSLLVLALLGTAIGLLVPYINEKVYDVFIPMGDEGGLLQICWVILACTLGNLTFTIVKNLMIFRSTSSIQHSVQAATYDRLFHLPENFFRHYDSADLAQRAMSVGEIFKVSMQTVFTTGLAALFSLLYLWRMFRYSKKLSVFSLILLVLAVIVIALLGWRQTRHEGKLIEIKGKMDSRLYQLLSGVDKLRMAGVEDRALYEYVKPYTESKKVNISKERIENAVNTLTTVLTSVFSLVLYYVMIKKLDAEISMGAFMGFSAAFGSFSGAMLQAVSSILKVNDIAPVYDRAKPILETLPELEENVELPGDLSGDIEINGVTFSYSPDRAPVLSNLSLHIHPGEYIGIVGPSGCGKSTLLKLLLGFEKPQSGKIFYDGRDIDGMDKRELRKKFGVVLQNGKLISGSIYENITITAPGASMQRVKDVVRAVGLEEDIAQMPMGLHTVLSENSGTISGGQQQRILIARAIINNPKIIFFDEATSALDNLTQKKVCESLNRLRATRLVIAHRLSTIIQCDRIIVMDQGGIQECGTYQELMAQKGMFYELAKRQLQ